MTAYKVGVAAHYSGYLSVDADSEEKALELVTEGLPSWLSTEDGDLDYWGSEAEIEEENAES